MRCQIVLNLESLCDFTRLDLLVRLANHGACFVNLLRRCLVIHIDFLDAVVVENGKTSISREDSLDAIPGELHSDRAHLAERALNNKGFLAAVVDSAELPLDIVLVAHVIVIVNRLLWRFEMARELGEVEKLQLLAHLLYLSLGHHFSWLGC